MLQGTIEGHEHSYTLGEGHIFEMNRPVLVCGNIVAMLGDGGISHLGKHFQVSLLVLTLINSSLVCKPAIRQADAPDERGPKCLTLNCDVRTCRLLVADSGGHVSVLIVKLSLQIIGDRSCHFGAFKGNSFQALHTHVAADKQAQMSCCS